MWILKEEKYIVTYLGRTNKWETCNHRENRKLLKEHVNKQQLISMIVYFPFVARTTRPY